MYCGMGWLRFVGSLKLQVSFAKEPYKTDDILPAHYCRWYGVATICRLLKITDRLFHRALLHAYLSCPPLKIIGLFCKRDLLKR